MKKFNYNDFVVGTINRKLNETNLCAKIKSISEYGLLSPLTVVKTKAGKYLIIDGQHRFRACVKLQVPIMDYNVNIISINEKDIISVMSEMNGQVLRWKKMDFVEVYAKDGNETYEKILNFTGSYPDFGITPYITMLSIGGVSQKNTKHYLENGEFEVSDFDMAFKIADDLMRIKEYSNYYKHFQFVMAFAKVWQLPEFNMDWFIGQLSKKKHLTKDGRDIFNGVANQSRFRELICQVYNANIRGGDSAKIF